MSIDPVQEKRFNVRAAVPDHLEVFANWRKASDAYKGECPDARLDLSFGESPSETLDFFPAKGGDGMSPLVLLIHGGYWQALDKADNAFCARGLNDAGAAVAVVNHTLCPHASLDEITEQIRRASMWLWRNASDLGADRDQMVAIGHSAGGHLAAMMMCTDWRAIDPLAPVDLFKGAVGISGLYDLTQLVQTTINDKVGLTEESARVLSPVNHVPVSKRAFITTVGGDESDGFHDQAAALQKAWRAHGVEVERMTLPGCHHLQALEALTNPNMAIYQKALSLIS